MAAKNYKQQLAAKGRRFTKREDDIIGRCSFAEARRRLPHRSKGVISRRRYKLRHDLPSANTLHGVRWAAGELSIITDLYTVTPTKELMKMLPGRSFEQINGKARNLGLKKRYCGATTDRLMVPGGDLIDQIRIRAKEDGLTFQQLDKALKTARYFQEGCRRNIKRVNIINIMRAVEFFGAKLTIDWCDR